MPEPSWPRPFHPASYPDGVYTVDTDTVVDGYQLQPGTWSALAQWCGGEQVVLDGNQAVRVGASHALLGDFVMHLDGFEVSPADGHYQRYAPADSADIRTTREDHRG